MRVTRYGYPNKLANSISGDFLRVGNLDLGEFRDISEAEYQRAKHKNPENPAFHMRPMFYSGSPYLREIIELTLKTRGDILTQHIK